MHFTILKYSFFFSSYIVVYLTLLHYIHNPVTLCLNALFTRISSQYPSRSRDRVGEGLGLFQVRVGLAVHHPIVPL